MPLRLTVKVSNEPLLLLVHIRNALNKCDCNESFSPKNPSEKGTTVHVVCVCAFWAKNLTWCDYNSIRDTIIYYRQSPYEVHEANRILWGSSERRRIKIPNREYSVLWRWQDASRKKRTAKKMKWTHFFEALWRIHIEVFLATTHCSPAVQQQKRQQHHHARPGERCLGAHFPVQLNKYFTFNASKKIKYKKCEPYEYKYLDANKNLSTRTKQKCQFEFLHLLLLLLFIFFCKKEQQRPTSTTELDARREESRKMHYYHHAPCSVCEVCNCSIGTKGEQWTNVHACSAHISRMLCATNRCIGVWWQAVMLIAARVTNSGTLFFVEFEKVYFESVAESSQECCAKYYLKLASLIVLHHLIYTTHACGIYVPNGNVLPAPLLSLALLYHTHTHSKSSILSKLHYIYFLGVAEWVRVCIALSINENTIVFSL